MTDIRPGVRVRIAATAHPQYAGRVGTVQNELHFGRWRVFLDTYNAYGRREFSLYDADELEVLPDGGEE